MHEPIDCTGWTFSHRLAIKDNLIVIALMAMDDMCFYIKNDHATVELLNYSQKSQSMVYTRLSLILTSLGSYVIIT